MNLKKKLYIIIYTMQEIKMFYELCIIIYYDEIDN